MLRGHGQDSSSGAEVLGVHLEGPFIDLEGGREHAAAHVLRPDPELLGRLLELGPVRMITLAPELDGADELMALAVNRGVVVSAGHSNVAFEPAYGALDGRVAGVTHLFNAMSALHHREPGAAGGSLRPPEGRVRPDLRQRADTFTPRWSGSPSACSVPIASASSPTR